MKFLHRPAHARPRRHRLAALLAIAALALPLSACDSSIGNPAPSSGTALSNKQEQLDFTHLQYVEPLPGFPYSEMRQDLIEIEAIEALGIDSTTFVFVQGISHPVYVCPSVGVPIPVTDQLSNDQVPVWNSGSDNQGYGIAGVTEDQADPPGVFQGDSTGTNSLCLNGSGGQYDIYNEAYDLTVTAPAYWDQTTGMIKLNGPAVYPVCHVVVVNAKKEKAEEICSAPGGHTTTNVPAPPAASPSPSARASTSSYRVTGVTRRGVTLAS
jgi:hypothetical protein